MGIFKKNVQNQPAPVADNTYDKLDAARSNGNQMYNILDSINFDALANRPEIITAEVEEPSGDGTTTKKGGEVLNDIHSKVEYLKKLLRTEISAELVKINSERLDAQIIFFAEMLKSSLETYNLVTAMSCILGLGYGIQKGHKPLPVSMTDRNSIEKELAKREEKINLYKSVVQLCMKNDLSRKQLKALADQYVNTKQKFEEVHEEFIREKNIRPDVYKNISGFTGNEATSMGPEYFEAWKLAAKHNNLYEQGKILNTQKSYVEQSINLNDQHILSLRNAAIMCDYDVDPELNMQIRKQLKAITQNMENMQSELLTSQEALEKYYTEFETIVNSSQVKEEIYSVVRKAEEISAEAEKQKIAEREGEVRYKQYLKEEAEKEAQAIEEERKLEEELQKIDEHKIRNKKKQTASFN